MAMRRSKFLTPTTFDAKTAWDGLAHEALESVCGGVDPNINLRH